MPINSIIAPIAAPNMPVTYRGTRLAFGAGAFFALRVAITFVCVRGLGLEPPTGAAVTVASGLFLLTLICFHSLGRVGFSRTAVFGQPAMRWVFLFLLVSGVSFAWSGAVSPLSSFAYWIALAADVASVLVLLRHYDCALPARALMRGFVWATNAIAILAWIMPAQSDLRLGDPDYLNTNQIGNLCAFALLLAQYLERSGRVHMIQERWPVSKAFLLLTLVRSLSKTTLVALAVSQGYLFLRDTSVSRKKKAGIAVGTVIVLLAFWGLFAAYIDMYTTTGNQSETLTGRTAIWAFALDSALAKPWAGNGFDSLWKVMPPFGPDHFEARHAENEWLQQFYAYGAIGILVLFGLYRAVFRQFRRVRELPLRRVLIAILLYVVVRGLAEAEPFDLLLPLWMIVMFSAVAYRENESTEAAASLGSLITHVNVT